MSFARNVLTREPFEVRELIERDAISNFDPVPAFARIAEPASARRFADDVRFLMGLFAELTAINTMGVRLARVDKAMCPRFHTDLIPLRFLFTYCGAGTEWLADEDVDRGRLGEGNRGFPDEVSGLMRPGATVRQVPESTVALLKGAAWPGNEKKGAVHRSPTPRNGERRVLLSLDVID